jgi:cytochrome c556
MRTPFVLIPAAAALVLSASVIAQTPKPAAPRPRAAAPQSGYKPTATVKDLMDFIVIPSSEAVFNAVSSTTGANGVVEDKVPKTDADWAAVRKSALLLAEAGNLLMVPGRHIAGPKDKSNNPGSELEPAQMEALVAKDRAGFAKKAQGLIDATMLALKAIDAKNTEGVSDAGGEIDAACESCHLTFWYPNETKK